MLTCKRIPIPAKIALEGGNTYVSRQSVNLTQLEMGDYQRNCVS